MKFEMAWLAWAAPAAAVLVGLVAWWARQRRLRAAGAWSSALVTRLRADGRWSVAWLSIIALVAVLGAAGPRWGRSAVLTESRALNVVLALDISRSMLAEDVAPNRLAHATREASRVLLDSQGDRVGLLAFAGRSYILAPLTLDGGAVGLYLDSIDPDLASEGGTNLASVLRQGAEVLGAAGQGGDRALVIFTDGEGHDSVADAVAAATDLKAADVRLILVAQGGVTPVKIPIRDSTGRLVEYKKDTNGAIVLTERRDDLLQQVAEAAGGTLVAADTPDQAGAVRATLAALVRRPAAERRLEDLVPRAWVVALVGALLLLLSTLTRHGASLIGIGLIGVLARPASAQRPPKAEQLSQQGDSVHAAEEYLREARLAGSSDTAWYNAGTAALRAGDFERARQALVVAGNSVDPDLRFRALYNLGLVSLRQARVDSVRRDTLNAEAAKFLKDALLLQPVSADAKWNLELATRHRPPPSGGGGRAPPPPKSPAGGGGQGGRGAPPPAGGLSKAEAEQILASVERAEREVRSDQAKRRRPPPTQPVKDW